jgi:hypothetical protein
VLTCTESHQDEVESSRASERTKERSSSQLGCFPARSLVESHPPDDELQTCSRES